MRSRRKSSVVEGARAIRYELLLVGEEGSLEQEVEAVFRNFVLPARKRLGRSGAAVSTQGLASLEVPPQAVDDERVPSSH
jgi:hypothetical protein